MVQPPSRLRQAHPKDRYGPIKHADQQEPTGTRELNAYIRQKLVTSLGPLRSQRTALTLLGLANRLHILPERYSVPRDLPRVA